MTSDEKTDTLQKLVAALPHSADLGMLLTEAGDGHAVMTLRHDRRFVGDTRTGALAGGVILALLDTCAGAAVLAHPSAPGGTATLDLRIEHLRPAGPGFNLTARAECYRMAHPMAFVRAIAWTHSMDEPVAAAMGVFSVEPSFTGKDR